MRNARYTSVYVPERALTFVKKGKGLGMTSGVAGALERYVDLISPTKARIEREFSSEIPVLAKIAPLKEWRAQGIQSAVFVLVRESSAEDIAPLDRRELLARIEVLTILESYALAEAIEERASHE